jgi:hypothetical protein
VPTPIVMNDYLATDGGLFDQNQNPRFLLVSGLGSSCLLRVNNVINDLLSVPQKIRVATVEHVLVGYGGFGGPRFYTSNDGPTAPVFASSSWSTLSNSVSPSTCPALGQRVYPVFRRTLYAVLRLRDGERPGLYELAYDMRADRFTEPTMIAVGVDDMAARPMIPCGPAACDVTDGGANGADFPYNGPTANAASQLVGISIQLLSRGLTDTRETATDAGYTFADGSPPLDGLRRDVREAKIPLYNFNQAVILPD